MSWVNLVISGNCRSPTPFGQHGGPARNVRIGPDLPTAERSKAARTARRFCRCSGGQHDLRARGSRRSHRQSRPSEILLPYWTHILNGAKDSRCFLTQLAAGRSTASAVVREQERV